MVAILRCSLILVSSARVSDPRRSDGPTALHSLSGIKKSEARDRCPAIKQLELMHKYLGDLGLSPVSHTRVSTTTPPGPKPWEYGLRQGSKFEGLLGTRD